MQFTDFENYPILIHCTQGKDRTGIIIALLLDICHVPSDLIIQDYVVSSSELKVERPIMLKTFSAVGLDPVFADSPGYAIKDTLAMIRTKYRSAQEYLIGIGVDMEMQHRVRQNVMTGGKRTKI
ncbi:protein-tyrosine phosphatase-like protein [Paraphysoderma sedebokerense]|nr:protein-tyrosine phosphatase-like protein [Paraphysoderma sedebokerense]